MSLSNERRAELISGPYTRILGEYEMALAGLYEAFSEAFASTSSFWHGVANEEVRHSEQILDIDEKLRSGEWRFKRPPYTVVTIVEAITHITDFQARLAHQGLTMKEALEKAVDIEQGSIESGFFVILENDTPAMVEALKSLENETRNHAMRIEAEARRLKWKIFGHKRRKLPDAAAPTTPQGRSNLKLSIKAAQADLLGLMIGIEEAAADLYNTYSKVLPDDQGFWHKVAEDEIAHAKLLRGLYRLLDRGYLFSHIEGFNRSSIALQTEFIVNAEARARHESLTAHDAINTALTVERFFTESMFYQAANSDAPEWKHISARLIAHSRAHVRCIEEKDRGAKPSA